MSATKALQGVVLLDADGNEITLDDGATIGSAEGVIIAGQDGAVARFVRVADDGTVRIDPTGTTTQPVGLRDVEHGQSAQFSVFGLQKFAQESLLADLRFDKQALVEDWDITRVNGGNYQPEIGGVGIKLFTKAQIGSRVEFVSRRKFRYQSGRGMLLKMSIVLGDAGVAGNVRQWGFKNTNGDALYLEMNGTTLQFVHNRNGSNVSTTAASAFDTPVTADANGHIWFIQYPWLGVADIFVLYDNAVVHRSVYIGTSQEFSLGDPDMHVFLSVENVSNATSVFMKSGCASVVIEGGNLVAGLVSGEGDGVVRNISVNNAGAISTVIRDSDTHQSPEVYRDNRSELSIRDDISHDLLRSIFREIKTLRIQMGHATEVDFDGEDDQ